MGAWRYLAPQLAPLLPGSVALRYVGRPPRASTAEGAADAHAAEQARVVAEALALPPPVTEGSTRVAGTSRNDGRASANGEHAHASESGSRSERDE